MRTIRRNDLAPRFEMTPMIDVIFLLLTFFIYSMVMMVRAEVLPVTLTTLATGSRPSVADVHAVTIDKNGAFFYNRQAVDDVELDRRLAELAAAEPPPRLYLAVEAQGSVDRGPLFINLLERVRRAGITDFAIVGQPAADAAPPTGP